MKQKEKVDALSSLARGCAHRSALISGCGTVLLKKDESGVPKSDNGIHWSISHKNLYVAGIVSSQPVGIDIEMIKPVESSLFEKIVSSEERRRFGFTTGADHDDLIFFRAFTAKESVLKKNLVGLKGLARVKIDKVIDPDHLIVSFEGKKTQVEHFYLDDHVVSVTKELFDIQWTIEDSAKLNGKP